MNIKSNYFQETVTVNGFSNWKKEPVKLTGKNNPVEKVSNLNDQRKRQYKTVIMNDQEKQLNNIHFWISLIMWLLFPVMLSVYITGKILTTLINYIEEQVKLHIEMNQLVEKVRIDSYMNSLDEMFNEIGYEKQTQ